MLWEPQFESKYMLSERDACKMCFLTKSVVNKEKTDNTDKTTVHKETTGNNYSDYYRAYMKYKCNCTVIFLFKLPGELLIAFL